jgi:GTP-binding protein
MTLIALLGRPNAGKSTLFNTLARGQRALVHATPGTTRDSRRCPAQLNDLRFDLLDTAGLDDEKSGIAADITALALKAAKQADVLLYLIDGASGPLPADATLVRELRKLGKPIIPVLTKSDLKSAAAHLADCGRLGLGTPAQLSAAHNNVYALHEALAPHLQSSNLEPQTSNLEARPLRIALLGQPNAGKSTLANRLLGAERMLTGPTPGLTREAIPHAFRHGGQAFILTDTPGLRKKSRIDDDLEHWSAGQAIHAGQDADVAILLADASPYDPAGGRWQVLEGQDAKIAQTLMNAGRPLIVALTKWDAVADPKTCLEEAAYQARRTLTAIPQPLCLPLSAHTGKGVGALLKAAAALHVANLADIPTSRINRALAKALARRSPPLGKGHQAINLKFARQVGRNPPTIALFGTRVTALPDSYKQFLRNSLAESLDLGGLPLHLVFRSGTNPFARGG